MRLPFKFGPQIIHLIIYSQAGSIGKAVIEWWRELRNDLC